MALSFDNTPDQWNNSGSAPSADLTQNGFQAGYKPPASVFNRLWSKVYNCITEIHTKLSALHTTVSTLPNAKVYTATSSTAPTLGEGEICFLTDDVSEE